MTVLAEEVTLLTRFGEVQVSRLCSVDKGHKVKILDTSPLPEPGWCYIRIPGIKGAERVYIRRDRLMEIDG